MMPRWFILLNIHWFQFDLCRALSAPVRNTLNVEWIEKKIAEWDLILLQKDRPLL